MATRVSEAMPNGPRYEPTPKWVRGELDGETVVDSKRAVLVWEEGAVVPGYAFPREDMKVEPLEAHLRDCEDRELEGYAAVPWDAMDRWLEEEEEVLGHPRDPFHRVDIRRSSRRVVVALDGERVAETSRPSLLFETGLPVRFYMPLEDVREDLLIPSDKETICAYKGRASYWSLRTGERVHEDIVWCYREPLADAGQIRDLVAFFNERADITVDGEQLKRPRTQWSVAA